MGIQDLQTVRLDINNKYDIELTCKQLDDIILKIIIYDKSLKADLSNYTCRLKAFKADQVPLIQNSNITIDGNIVTIKANSQLTTTAGVVKAELQFINKTTSEKKSTFYLNIEVVASSLYVDSGLSTPTITLLQELDNKLDQIENIGTVLDEAITVKSELETNISTATKTKSDLATINTNATTTKNDLETLNTNAIQTKSDLDSANVLAGDNKSDLDIKNALATQNIQQMDSFGDVSTLVQNVTELKADKTEILNTIGDETMGVTATTLKGAIAEVKRIADSNTTQLKEMMNDKMNKLESKITDFNKALENGLYPFDSSTINGYVSGGYGLCRVYKVEQWVFQTAWYTNGINATRRKINNDDWSKWSIISNSEVVELTLNNGWVALDKTPTLYVNGKCATLNIRIKDGAYSTGTRICSTGLTPYKKQLIYFPFMKYGRDINGNCYIDGEGNVTCGDEITFNGDCSLNVTYLID